MNILLVLYLLSCVGFCLGRSWEGKPSPWWGWLLSPLAFPISFGAAIGEIMNKREEPKE